MRRRPCRPGNHDAARDQQGDVRRMSLLSDFSAAAAPPVAVELAAGRVSAAAVEFRGGHAYIVAHASEPVPEGALVSSLTNENIRDRATVRGVLAQVFDRIGGRPRRVGLIVPDPIAK